MEQLAAEVTDLKAQLQTYKDNQVKVIENLKRFEEQKKILDDIEMKARENSNNVIVESMDIVK